MTAIPTIISLYKHKYYPIGATPPGSGNGIRSTTPGSSTGGASPSSLDDAKIGAYVNSIETTLKTAFESISKWSTDATNQIANMNVGLAQVDNLYNELNKSIGEVVASITMFEERESELTKVFKTGTEVLAKRTYAYTALQKTIGASNDQMAGYRATMEINSSLLGKAFAENATKTDGYVANTTKAYNYLSRTTSLTADQQASLELYAAGAGRSLLQQVSATKELAKKMKDVVDPSTAFEAATAEIATMSADIRQQYRGTGGALEIAVMRSKKLGISMAQLHKTGESLLNIESSVGKELEYQLISGRRLVDNQGNSLTNMYRQAMMSGDASKMQDAMTKVYESQSEVLEGNNYLAKQALAESLGMSQQELMASHEKYKLQEKITAAMGDQYDLDAIMRDPAKQKAFKMELSKTDSDLAASFEKISENEDRNSPAQRILLELRSLRETGLNVKMVNYNTDKDGKKTVAKDKNGNIEFNLEGARQSAGRYKETASEPFKKFFEANGGALTEMIGRYQNINKGMATMSNVLTGISTKLPYFGTQISALTTKITEIIKNISGTNVTVDHTKVDKINAANQAAASATHQDAVLNINDGVIAKFHPNDKITTVVASPYGAMNERIAGKIANPKTNNSSGAEITQLTNAINSLLSKQATPQTTDNKSIVSAIQTALGNVSITVALDPMAIDKEIKFRSGNLNKASI